MANEVIEEAQDLLVTGPAEAGDVVALAHGAGAGMDSPFLAALAAGLAEAGVRTARFEFPYMRRRRVEGRRLPPDPPAVLERRWEEVIAGLGGPETLVLAGKSMGGRIASMVVDRLGARGLVCVGYPFHPPGRPETPRVKHLGHLETPALIVQGTRDPFGRPDEVAGYQLSPRIELAWITDGDHSLVPRRASGRAPAESLAEAVQAIVGFLGRLRPSGPGVAEVAG